MPPARRIMGVRTSADGGLILHACLAAPCAPEGESLNPPGLARTLRRDAGAVERGGLENRCTRERTVGSNPTPSANIAYADSLSVR